MKRYIVVKKILDFIFALFLLVLLFPVMLIAAFVIKLETDGPVLFKQERPGKGSKIFTVYKFRTMSVGTEKNGKQLSDIDRITKVGAFLRKTSIDELPQLFNILRGEISFIGPRPLLIQYLEHYSKEQIRRHEVTPGISGWAQVNGRNAISWDEKFKLDVWYVDNQSILLDLKILILTIYNVVNKNGINNSESDTMPYFIGSINKENSSIKI